MAARMRALAAAWCVVALASALAWLLPGAHGAAAAFGSLFVVRALGLVQDALAGALGFGAVVAFPLLLVLSAGALAWGSWRERKWAEVATLGVVTLLALGSAGSALLSPELLDAPRSPGPHGAWRAANLLLALGLGFVAWRLRPDAEPSPDA